MSKSSFEREIESLRKEMYDLMGINFREDYEAVLKKSQELDRSIVESLKHQLEERRVSSGK